MKCELFQGNCLDYLKDTSEPFHLTFLDPPFNQNKDYRKHNDDMDNDEYWKWMAEVSQSIFERTECGGAIYFMQREKNAHLVIRTLIDTGWSFQNLIIWKKKASAVPEAKRFGKHYQIIVYATKGKVPRVFNKLRINPPLLVTEKYSRSNGMFVTDVWDDIRELTSGYYAGEEPIRLETGERAHKQQSPVALLLRIILSSSVIGDTIFDPFAGTGTTLVTGSQLRRRSIGAEIDPENIKIIRNRLTTFRKNDDVLRFRKDYSFTENLDQIWGDKSVIMDEVPQLNPVQYMLFEDRASSYQETEE